VPADAFSTLLLILLNAGQSAGRVAPYVAGGIAVAGLLSWLWRGRRWAVPSWLPRPLAAPLVAVAGIVSPLPTTGLLPLALQWQTEGLPGGPVLTFVLASSLLNPQLFVLTWGTLGARFALAQVAGVLLLSVGLGLMLGRRGGPSPAAWGQVCPAGEPPPVSPWAQLRRLAEHVILYVLLGVTLGAALQVLLPQWGVLNWLGRRGWLSTPLLGWLGAPFYTCGGSAVPLAGSLAQIGFSPGALFTFLLVGPALRGTTLANLGCLLPRRARAACLLALLLAGGLLGYVVEWLKL